MFGGKVTFVIKAREDRFRIGTTNVVEPAIAASTATASAGAAFYLIAIFQAVGGDSIANCLKVCRTLGVAGFGLGAVEADSDNTSKNTNHHYDNEEFNNRKSKTAISHKRIIRGRTSSKQG